MWPAATRLEAALPSAHGPASAPTCGSSVHPPVTISHAPAPTTPPAAAQKREFVRSPRPVSPDSFIKDGREIRVGDCALFRAVDVPPFVGLIRLIEKQQGGYPKLRVSWLYRPADVELNKGIQLNAAPNEIFFSFHQDETSAVSLLHPCKVAFLRKGAELSSGISSFACWRVYDIDNKCLWWLTDRDYIDEEVNRLLYRTRLEMHAAVQSGGHSPKRLNVPSASQQLKASSDGAQNCGPSKGKKRDRVEQGIDPAKRDRDCLLKDDDTEPGNFKGDNMKLVIAKITEKSGLPHAEAVEKLVHFIHHDQTERKMDFADRVRLADIIAATESPDCLNRFMQLRGLPVLNDWLQETHKGKSGEGGSPKDTDKPIEDLILALLRALAKLPISLTALQSCSIGKSVNHLRSHKNPEIQKKAKCLVENWKKRVDAEMKSTDAKPVLSGPAISWSGKAVFPEISSAGNGRSGSSEPSPRNPLSQLSSPKALSAKPGTADAAAKSNPFTSASSKLQHIQPANVTTNLKDPPCNSAGGTCGPDFPSVKEEKSCSSSQSLNNSQSCSSDHGKTVGPMKDDARRSTAASANASKISGSSARGHRRSNNGLVKKEVGFQKEAALGRSSPLDRSLLQERSSQSGMACEKGGETLSDHVNSHRLIVRFPNPGRSPGRSTIGASCEDPSISGSRASSPVLADKHEQNDRRVKMKTEHSRPHLGSDANAEPARSNHIEGATGSEEGDKSSCGVLDGDCSRTAEEAGKDASASQGPCSLYVNEKDICIGETTVRNSFNPLNALIEIKYSEASHSMQAGDDTAMNLLASVAGEVSRSELVMPSTSPGKPPVNELGCEGKSIGKLEVECDAGPSQHSGPSDDVEKDISEKEDKSNVSFVAKEEQHLRDSGTNSSSHGSKGATSTRPSPLPGIDSKAVESSANTGSHEVECANKCSHIPSSVDSLGGGDQKSSVRQPADIKIDTQFSRSSSVSEPRNAVTVREKVEDGSVSSSDQKHLLVLPDHLKINDRSTDSTAGKFVSKPSLLSSNEDVKNADGLVVKVPKEDEKKEQPCSTSADVTRLVLPAVLPPGPANGNGMVEESKGSSSELSSHVKPRALTSPDNEHSARQSSKKLCDDVGGKEDLVSSDEGSSVAAKAKSNGTAKLDFDLNELGDEGNHSGPATFPVICSSSIHLPGLSPFVSPISSGLPAAITVAAPAKGPFVPPENLLRVKPDAGWKGSAATSAFRPAEPRKVLGMFLTAPDTAVSDNAGKQSRPAFDIDLNVADDQVLEDDISQSSAQTIGSESGNSRSLNGRVQSAGIELDLNRADEVAENSQFMSNASHRIEVTLLPARPLPGVPSNTGTNSSRNFFDLNNGPCLDEASAELAQRSLSSKSSSSIPFLPQVPGVRMSSAEMSNMSPWFGSANSCAPVAVQSFLPARAEQPYPIDTAPGTQRFIAPAADGGQFRSDFCRAPVISTSPTMVFHSPAYQYAGFPFTPSVHLPTTGFPMGSTSYANAAPAGVPYFPTIVPSHVGSTGVLPVQHARQYAMNLTEGTSRDGHDSNWKWRRQGLDLNSGPGSIDVEGKDERLALLSRPNVVTPPPAFVEEQTRMYQMPGVGIKRKEPEGSWDAERSSSYKQLSWQ
ncbi:uncharacterized protein LOC100824814 isoform X2 [Brachypodium distachyon]|uniref:BAH domain-containing protein n=1 Tax=Brachypodium distachyon TaxID=15368 RepID=A0A0Q3FSF2_BRADI|nr:uncharacterized protein LOC100824814 isoform X2 [Brachypodium distachyon]KQK01967.1 hypothetical protein BRADI_3g59560v3 [Brachypodium distachyon]|eukprot:XP_010236130.1 uncharacterized protein LOC100824814 isoform X2 [Brachypodium distachyon]